MLNLGCNVGHDCLQGNFHVSFVKAKCMDLPWIGNVVKITNDDISLYHIAMLGGLFILGITSRLWHTLYIIDFAYVDVSW